MTHEHTPTPWILVNDNSEIHDIPTRYDDKGARIGDTPNLIAEIGHFNRKANAAFIVHAVNYHHELVEELQAALLAYEDIVGAMGNGEPYTLEELTSGLLPQDLKKARALIAKAKRG